MLQHAWFWGFESGILFVGGGGGGEGDGFCEANGLCGERGGRVGLIGFLLCFLFI